MPSAKGAFDFYGNGGGTLSGASPVAAAALTGLLATTAWTAKDLHQGNGNVLLGDGSGQQLTLGDLPAAFEAATNAVGYQVLAAPAVTTGTYLPFYNFPD
jgi:hypothetical protein